MPSGSDTCMAVHAEVNALLNCPDPEKIETAYVTHAPCLRCTKMLLNTSVKAIVFSSLGSVDMLAMQLAQKAGIDWYYVEPKGE